MQINPLTSPNKTRGIDSIDFRALEFHACSIAGHIWSCLVTSVMSVDT